MLTVYDDKLATGWYDLSWSATVDYNNTNPVASGSKSISYTATAGWAGMQLCAASDVNLSSYTRLEFAMRASQAGQHYAVYLRDSNWNNLSNALPLTSYGGDPTPDQWTHYSIPLADLNAANVTLGNIVFHSYSGSAQPAVYVDNIQFVTD